MTNTIQAYLETANDPFRPSSEARDLQRYDNYAIYDIYSTRIFTDKIIDDVFNVEELLDTRLLAVQHFNTSKPACDFNTIAQTYK